MFTQETPGLTFLQDLQMFPKDISHKVRCQLQEALLAQGTEGSSIHAELLEIHFLQAELVHCPHHPVPHVRLRPLLGVCRGISSEHPQAVFPGKSTQSMLQLPCTSTASSLEIGSWHQGVRNTTPSLNVGTFHPRIWICLGFLKILSLL